MITLPPRRLIHATLIVAALMAGQLQANESLLAENGSERTLEQIHKQRQEIFVELAEDGGERLIEHIRERRLKQSTQLAEDGAERILNARRS